MIAVCVQGGTGAGRRIVRQRERWMCSCWMCEQHPQLVWEEGADRGCLGPGIPRRHPGWRYSCPDCGARRPS